MAAEQLEHPDRGALSAFVVGKLESAEVDAIESHLASCRGCCETLKQIQDDTFVGLVRRARGSGATTQPDSRDTPSQRAALAETLPPQPGTAAAAVPPAELADHPRYRVVELIGSGGMGSVYKAEHRLMQRKVALKLIHPRFVQSKQAVERFRREVRAAARLQHPNIVHAYDAEQAGDAHFLVMEYVPGTDLGKVLAQRGPLPVSEACEYVRQAALGLQHAHEHGMVHRDIKPQNLMVVSGGWRVAGDASSSPATHHPPPSTKILDFGLASLTTEANADEQATQQSVFDGQKTGLTQAGSLMGTPDYMAPEQGRDARAADIRSDIYSLGCTLYFLLTGKPPFPGGTAIDKVIAHAEHLPAPVTKTRKDVPAGLVRVVDKMMAKDPTRRYQTPAEVAEALAPFAPRPAPARPPRWTRRRLLVTWAGLAAALLLFGVVYHIVTDEGSVIIQSQVEDVRVVLTQGGKEVEVVDLKTGSMVKRLRSGAYEVKLQGDRSDIALDKTGFTLKRGEQEIVRLTRVEPAAVAKPRSRPQPTAEIAPKYRAAIDKGLDYLVRTQHSDGHWEAMGGQYPVSMTALAGMALLMEGSTLHEGKYAEPIRKATEWLLAQVQPEGLLSNPNIVAERVRYMFGHGYSMLFLASVYVQEDEGEFRSRLKGILTKAVEFVATAQTKRGGWGYVSAMESPDFDEGCATITVLHGLRAARNAGIAVPRKLIDADYMRKSTCPDGGIVYSISQPGAATRHGEGRMPLTAAALAVCEYDSDLARKWLTFCRDRIGSDGRRLGHDEYLQFYYSQALYQLGDKGYEKLFPESQPQERLTWSKYRSAMFDFVLSRQSADGSWNAGYIGPVFATVCHLTILQLDNAAVPIYQR